MLFDALFSRSQEHSPNAGRISRPKARRKATLPRPRCIPRLEALEDRAVPAVFSVTSLADSGAGSLRQAILDANAAPGDDTIPIEVTGTINLSDYLPCLCSNMDIQGPGANLLTVQPGGFYVMGIDRIVGISGLTISNGPAEGIYNDGGTLTVSNCTISGNREGGIYNRGVLTVNNSTISGNQAVRGGGIYNQLLLTVNNSTISGNSAYGSVIFEDPSIGGGIYNELEAYVNNSTITGNSSLGGGISNVGRFFPPYLALRNTIVAGNTSFLGGSPDDVYGAVSSLGYNLIGNPAGGSGYAPTDFLGVDPSLGPLQDNGGPTPTHALLPGSPALDRGDPAFAPPPATDQRGLPRVVAGRLDIGAFEVQPGPVALFFLLPFTATAPAGEAFDLTVVALDGYGHVVADYAGEVLFFSTDGGAIIPTSYAFRPEDGGVARLEGAVTLRTPGPQVLLAVDAAFTALGWALYDVL